MERAIKRVNIHCAYYPCHKRLEDCTFCWCPLYPCLNENFGYYIYNKAHKKIWSCDKCEWIHQRNVVDKALKMIKGKRLREFCGE